MSVLDGLNDKQQEAVLNTEGYVRVIAGAGSGKTKLLVSRYVYLVQEYGIDPANILCVTFTNKAAGEMKRRIKAAIGDEYDTSLICTYHGFCVRLLREDAEKLFLSKNFQIIDAVQQKAILSEIFQKRELKLDYASFEMILKYISKYKNKHYYDYVPLMCSPEHKQIMGNIESQNDEIAEEYMQRLKSVKGLDFDDLMGCALYMLETKEEIRRKWSTKLNYIQVDEFQDSSKREMKLIDILSEYYKNLMIVGDPDQNIYEWRGSDVKLLVEFDRKHSPTNTIILARNYRSTPQILKCANSLISHNDLRLKKDLYTEIPEGVNVNHYHLKSDEQETEKLAELINTTVKSQGKEYSDIAILYRSGFLSRLVEKKLVEKNIPYEIYGGVKFFQRMEVQDIMAYLRVVAYGDDISLKRIINKPKRRFGRVKMAALEELAELYELDGEEGSCLLDLLDKHSNDEPFKNSDAEEFIAFVKKMREEIKGARITDIVNKVTTGSGYEEYISSLGDEERYENLMEFKRVADEFERNYGEDITLNEFLNQLSLQSSEDADTDRNTVKLMTIHAAKGLEFPVVFVIGFTEGIFPSSKTIEERKKLGLEEERRLCYVAITRAMERLYLMDSEGFSQNCIKKLPSRFLGEIGVGNYERIGVISDDLKKEANAYIRKTNHVIDGPLCDSRFKVGDVVEHHAFGKGKVIEIDMRRNTLTVQFDKMLQPRVLSTSYFSKEHVKNKDLPQRPTAPALPVEKKIGISRCVPVKERNISEDAGEDEPAEHRIKITPELKKMLDDTPNLWLREDVPHTGWYCTGVTDLGGPFGVCQMCGYHVIRYVHNMRHPDYHDLATGCVCAGKMEGDIASAKKREAEFKKRASRKENFANRKWKRSQKGNLYLKIKDHVVVLYCNNNKWAYSIDSKFCKKAFATHNEAVLDAFEALEGLNGSNIKPDTNG